MCQVKNLDESEYLGSLKSNHSADYKDLVVLSEKFDVSLDDLIHGKIDYDWIRNPKLPDKYTMSRGSKVRTSLVPLDFVKRFYGDDFYNFVRRSLKIPKESLECPDYEISVELLTDILDLLKSSGIDEKDFHAIGHHLTEIEENKEISQEFSGITKPKDVFEKLFNEVIKRYEKNFDYKIVSSARRNLRVEVTQKEELSDTIKKNLVNHPSMRQYRASACAAHLKFSGLGDAVGSIVPSLNPNTERFYLSW